MTSPQPAFPASAPPALGAARDVYPAPVVANASRRGRLPISKAVWRWFWISLGVRVIAAILIHLYSLTLGFGGYYPLLSGADDWNYFNLASRVHDGLPIGYVDSSYPYILAAFFHLVGGPDLLVGKLFNVLAGAITVALGVRIVDELSRGRMSKRLAKRSANIGGALLCFYPSLLWYSTQLVKDPLLVMLGMGAILFQIQFLKRAKPETIFAWVLCMVGLFSLRPYAALAIFISLLAWVMRFKRRLILPALVLIALVPRAVGKGFFGVGVVAPFLDAEKVSSFRAEGYSVGGSAVGITINYSNPVLFAVTYSYSYATAMFGPLPWQIKGAAPLVALPEAIGMWTLFSLWLGGTKRALFRSRREKRGHLTRAEREVRRELLLMLFCLILIGIIAIFSDNIGANTRLRLLPWSAFLLFAAPRLARKKWKVFG